MRLSNSFVLFLTFTQALADCQNNVSILKDHIGRVFSRRKRHVVFPLYGAMKITVATGKSIISKYPRGLNLSLEVSTYYPVPTQLEEWYPKRLRQKTTPKPAMNDTIVYIPGTPYRFKAKPPTIKPPINRIDKGPVQWIDTNWKKDYSNFSKAKPLTKAPKWKNVANKWINRPTIKYYAKPTNNKWSNNNRQQSKYAWKTANSDVYHRDHYQSFANQNTRYNWTKPIDINADHGKYRQFAYKTTVRQPNQRNRNVYPISTSSSIGNNWKTADYKRKSNTIPEDIFTHRPHQFDELEPYRDWKYIRGHRDRRDIYHHFEGFSSIFNFDMKSCIMRSICESKRVLLPPGYSLIQDIIRIVFSLPTLDGMIDEYSKAMRGDYGDCHVVFKNKCPFSLLDLIINSPTNK